MKRKLFFITCCALIIALVTIPSATAQGPTPGGRRAPRAALGTAFTYQGQLKSGGSPYSGSCDLQFGLYDDANAGTQIGTTQTKTATLTNGLFTIPDLDFGAGAFNGDARYLDIQVRCPAGSGSYTPLTPRQQLTPAPYALYASGAPWSGLTGIPAGFADGVDNDTTYTAGTGLSLSGTQFSIASAYQLPQSCSSNQIAKWNGTAWACGADNDTTTFWSLTGNSGTTPGTNFVGTTDNVTLTLRANNVVGWQLAPSGAHTPNVIGGDSRNWVTSGVMGATIGGGASGWPIRVTDNWGVVGGGYNNQAGNNAGTTDDAHFATVGGGAHNTASGWSATVGGGWSNTASGYYATIGGGSGNTASNNFATVSGGAGNTASSYAATIGGGSGNTASGDRATVGGGYNNTASGNYATVPGGVSNSATMSYTLAAGRRARANHDGAFVWADSTNMDFASSANNQFRVRSTGGAAFVLGIDGSGNPTWTCSVSNGGSWACASDRNLKENLTAADGRAVLTRLSRVPIYNWNAKGVDPSVRHLGPIAQDFYAAFGLGNDDKTLSTIDLDGVALAAIQGLYEVVQEQDKRIIHLESQVSELQKQNAMLDARLVAVEQAMGIAKSPMTDLLNNGWIMGVLLIAVVWVGRRRRGGER